MTKKTLSLRLTSRSDQPEQSGAANGGPNGLGPAASLQIAEYFIMNAQIELALDQIRRIDRSARLIIGGNLQARALDRGTLNLLKASVTRQARDAADMQQRLEEGGAADQLCADLANLVVYFDEALLEIERQLSRVH